METLKLLKQAAHEIKILRRKNELMSARLQMFDSVNAMIHARLPESNGCCSPDFLYEIEKHIDNEERIARNNKP